MTAATPAPQAPITDPAAALRRGVVVPFVLVALGCGALAAVIWPQARVYTALAAMAALVTGALVFRLEARAAMTPEPARMAGFRLQFAIALGFLVQLVLVAGTTLGLHLAGVKFSELTAFALTFAGAVLFLHLTAVLQLSRTLRARSSGKLRAPIPA